MQINFQHILSRYFPLFLSLTVVNKTVVQQLKVKAKVTKKSFEKIWLVAMTKHINFTENQKAFLCKNYFLEAIWSKQTTKFSLRPKPRWGLQETLILVDTYVRFLSLSKIKIRRCKKSCYAFNIFVLEISGHILTLVFQTLLCVAQHKLFSSRHFLVYIP